MLSSPLQQPTNRTRNAEHNLPACLTRDSEWSDGDPQAALLFAMIRPEVRRLAEEYAQCQHAGIFRDCLFPYRLVLVMVEIKGAELLEEVQPLRIFKHERRQGGRKRLGMQTREGQDLVNKAHIPVL